MNIRVIYLTRVTNYGELLYECHPVEYEQCYDTLEKAINKARNYLLLG